jgi:hypothetical protein
MWYDGTSNVGACFNGYFTIVKLVKFFCVILMTFVTWKQFLPPFHHFLLYKTMWISSGLMGGNSWVGVGNIVGSSV